MKGFLLSLLLFLGHYTIAQFKITDPEWLTSADAIVLDESLEFDVENDGKAIKRYHMKVMILNKKGVNSAVPVIHYDPLSPIQSLNITFKQAGDKKEEKVKSSEIKDESNISSFSVYEDNRVKYWYPQVTKYPAIVEYSYVQKFNGILFYPTWVPQGETRLAVVKSTFNVKVPENFPLQFKESMVKDKDISDIKGKEMPKKVYTWTFENASPLPKPEKMSPEVTANVPIVRVAPRTFTYDGFQGSLESWQSFGDWIIGLNQSTDDLPEATIKELKSLTANAESDLEKTKIVYDYLQKKVRYISIQLGIGGYQPMKASFVDEKSYGDCKALSNYTYSMLKALGIKSHYALIYGGSKNRRKVDENFVSSQFNHAILCVPNVAKDTLWLECTSQDAPFGHLGSFTGNRKALLIEEGNSRLVNTTKYTALENEFVRVTNLNLSAGSNDVSLSAKAMAGGYQYDRFSDWVNMEEKDRRERFLKYYSLNASSLIDLSVENNKQYPSPLVEVNYSLNIRSYLKAFDSGNTIEVYPYYDDYSMPKRYRSRKQPFEITYPYQDIDSVYFHLAEGVEIETLPEDTNLKNEVGEYQLSFKKVSDNVILVVRLLKMSKGIYPPELYSDYYLFWKKIASKDKQKFWVKTEHENDDKAN
ncbi:DUF3857 domain-containing protein [Flammeovirga pacifica]|uniref:DUF3857 domain-containing protein n=1 Tax=Flammeovirga pacifica TaxID=915059 RepID=A0A1S1Z0J6_FLAPC|nr:DUF3857 domain-containing protein [Flammeovirga pacifica]OHX66789.1 hypothetical protein NH26_10685 [Flammeovirga pacifica]